jgi:hypothetical protein
LEGPHEAIVAGGERLIGMQSMVLLDNTGGKISLVVPISYLREVFASREFVTYEKTISAGDRK